MADEQTTRAPAKRAGSRTSKAAEQGAPAGAVKPAKAPRPRYCRQFARARMAEAMPELVDALITKSEKGSLGHMKLLVQLSGLDHEPVKAPRRRPGGSIKALMDEWRELAVKREQ